MQEGEREDANKQEKEPRGLCVSNVMFSLQRITISRSGKGKNIEWVSERSEGNKDEETARRGREGNVTSSIMVQLLLCTTYSGWARRVGLYMLLHCGVQCSIISPSIPSALIEERVRRAGAREGGRLGKKKGRKRRRGCRWPHSDDIVYHFSL